MKYFFRILAVFIFMTVFCSLNLFAERDEHEFTLQKGKGENPFTLLYNITVQEPCEIRVYVEVSTADKDMKKPLKVEIFKKGIARAKSIAKYDSDKKTFQVRYAVDSVELNNGKEYMIGLSNISITHRASGKLMIVYTGKEGSGANETKPAYPDLMVSDIFLNDDGYPVAEITNIGGHISSKYWDTQKIYIEGSIDRVFFPFIYLNRKVREPDGKVTQVLTKEKITGKKEVFVIVDKANIVPDANRDNNTLRKTLGK